MVNQNSDDTNREGSIKRKAVQLALQFACRDMLIAMCRRPDGGGDGGMDEFYQLALRELGFDPDRIIDAELVDEIRPKLLERGVNLDDMVESVEREIAYELEAIAEVGRHH